MNKIPTDFFPELDEEERRVRWDTMNEEYANMAMEGFRQGKSLYQIGIEMLNYSPEDASVRNRPFYMRDCTNEDVLRVRGYM